MKRIHFTPEDAMRVRIGPPLSPFGETLLAARMLQRSRAGMFTGWRAQVRDTVPVDFGLLAELVPPDNDFVDLITPLREARSMPEALEALRLAPREELRREVNFTLERRARRSNAPIPAWAATLPDRDGGVLRDIAAAVEAFHSVAFAGRWAHVQTHLDLTGERLARTLATEGVERLLAGLGRWRTPVLEIATLGPPPGSELRLRGRGLTITPSLFAWPDPIALKSSVDEGAPVRLIVPALRDPGDFIAAWGPRPRNDALVALLGRTRAAVLEVVAAGCTTTELARRLAVSPATASEHASILRRAGLIDSRRERNAMRHELTTLGAALLDGELDRGLRSA
ncbi:ArsR/SmtB family transcription factor [Nocardia pseudobrasiliensis]|uniref:ArsR family transcriptional regulator n=1 Tax=Nocardia pseudobrasiliensis TaxID=45979 RepID=A0A370HPY0_9NOCA|nr:winged helix-turn-helix domain-containing protein [Nocardia pseudobrasiliensis]RDI60558.1 ArsR family transcriptional regulator [Nocardia pseudobrasiliensis]